MKYLLNRKTYLVLICDFFDDTTWISCSQNSRRNIVGYDTSGTNNGIVTYSYAAENGATTSYPHTVAYGNGFWNQGTRYPFRGIE